MEHCNFLRCIIYFHHGKLRAIWGSHFICGSNNWTTHKDSCHNQQVGFQHIRFGGHIESSYSAKRTWSPADPNYRHEGGLLEISTSRNIHSFINHKCCMSLAFWIPISRTWIKISNLGTRKVCHVFFGTEPSRATRTCRLKGPKIWRRNLKFWVYTESNAFK